jgi:hypothetical protein
MAFCRIKDLKNTPIYVRPQFSSGGGVVTLTMMVGIRANIGKPVDNITVQLLLPPSVVSSDLTANFGTILPNHGTKVLSSISNLDAIYLCIQMSQSGWCHYFFFWPRWVHITLSNVWPSAVDLVFYFGLMYHLACILRWFA